MPSSFLVCVPSLAQRRLLQVCNGYCSCDGEGLCTGPVEGGSCFSASVFCLPALCHLAESFALLVGSDLRTGYGEGIIKEESSFLFMVFFGKSHVYQEVRWLWCT